MAERRRAHKENPRRRQGLEEQYQHGIGSAHFSTSFRVHVQLQDLRLVTESGQTDVTEALASQRSSLEDSIKPIHDAQIVNEKSLERMEQQLFAISRQINAQKPPMSLLTEQSAPNASHWKTHAPVSDISAFAAQNAVYATTQM